MHPLGGFAVWGSVFVELLHDAVVDFMKVTQLVEIDLNFLK
jgi:hypothetical protein